jgi:hypothetical protein
MRTRFRWRNVANRGRVGNYYDQEYSPTFGTDPINERIPSLALLASPRVGFEFFEDFLTLPLDDTTRNPANAKWVSDTAADSITLPKVVGGVVNVATGGTDNNETYIQFGGAASITAAPFKITDASGKALWFEARVRALEHADEGVFVGLAEEGAAVANFLTDNSGAVADKDFIGFNILTATPAAWNTTWRKNGQAVVTNANVVANADDWHYFGFFFDGESTVTFYIDGVAHATTATTSAATFPSGELMAPIIAIKTGEAVAKNVQVDYIRVVQAR